MINFRRFNGSSDVVTLALGALSNMTFGTVAVLCRRTDDSQWTGPFTTRSSGGSAELFIDIAPGASGSLLWWNFASAANSGVVDVPAADDWSWAIICKATGTQAPRALQYVMSTGTWTRADGAAIGDAVSPAGGSLQIGNAGGDFFKGDIAAVAVWKTKLADATLDGIVNNWVSGVLAASPDAAWLLNQASTATAITDQSTTGTANQTALSGTTVQSGTIPNWSETAGGTTTPITLTGTLTLSGSIGKLISKVLGGSTTPTGIVSMLKNPALATNLRTRILGRLGIRNASGREPPTAISGEEMGT